MVRPVALPGLASPDDQPGRKVGMEPPASPMRDIECAVNHADLVPNAPSTTVTDWEDVSVVLRDRAFAPIRAESGHGGQWHTLLIADSVIDLHGDEHFQRRRVLSALFKRAALLQEYEHDYLIPLMDELVAELRARP